ncbi:MAG: hypothetical protein Q9217_004078 [Psora testacea]
MRYDLRTGDTMTALLLSTGDFSHVLRVASTTSSSTHEASKSCLRALTAHIAGCRPILPAVNQPITQQWNAAPFQQMPGTPASLTGKTSTWAHPTSSLSSLIRDDLTLSTLSQIRAAWKIMNISPYHFHTTILQILLSRTLDIKDICIGSVDANRSHPKYYNTFGPFFSYLPLRFHLPFDPPFPSQTFPAQPATNVTKTKATATSPFDIILDSLGIDRMPATHHLLYQVQINYLQHNH